MWGFESVAFLHIPTIGNPVVLRSHQRAQLPYDKCMKKLFYKYIRCALVRHGGTLAVEPLFFAKGKPTFSVRCEYCT